MTRPVLLGLVLAACAPAEPHAVLAALDPTSVEVPIARYPSPPPSASFFLENQGASTLYVTAAPDRATGDRPELVHVDLVPFTTVAPAQKIPVRVSLDERRWLWDSGTFQVEFPIEVRYYFSGQAQDEPEDVSSSAPPDPQAAIRTVSITFTIDCDLDKDGVEAVDCGGDDCVDDDADIRPGLDEVCDGIDQDCDGAIDEGAVDRDVWFFDGDGDGFGDPETETLVCSRPGVKWIAVGDDCDDADERVNPSAFEICDDGINNNCNRFVQDCRDPQCENDVVCTGG